MERSVLAEINKKAMDAYLQRKVYGSDLYFPTFFPFRGTPLLSFETITGSKGRRVAADVIEYDASAPEKKRKAVYKLRGDIPKTAIKRIMSEKDINEYNMLKAMATPDEDAILELVFGDIDFCVEGANARLEWLSLQAASQGTISLTTSNNVGLITETTIDYQMDGENKRVLETGTATRPWGTGTASQVTPITDIRDVVEAGKSLGLKFNYILMNQTKWLQFCVTDEAKYLALPFTGYSPMSDPTKGPQVTIQAMNGALRAQALPQIVIVDQSITLETAEHSQSNADPWTTKYVLFAPDLRLGRMFHGPIAEETNKPAQAMHSKRGPILVSKWSEVDPVREYTKAEINAFPSFDQIDMCIRLDTENYAADGLDD